MKRLITLLMVAMPMLLNAQQLKVYTAADGYKYFALYAYGLPREVVKSNAEIKASKFGSSGIMRRHHSTKNDDAGIGTEGYNANIKISFAFLIAPYNVDASGAEIKGDSQTEVTWYDASGWDPSIDSNGSIATIGDASTPNPTPTGCAAYRGPKGTDAPGSWRLPTQREALTMFTIMEHALTMQNTDGVVNKIINGKYWTSTELKTTSLWHAWYVDSQYGSVFNVGKLSGVNAFARCVKDIDDDPINE